MHHGCLSQSKFQPVGHRTGQTRVCGQTDRGLGGGWASLYARQDSCRWLFSVGKEAMAAGQPLERQPLERQPLERPRHGVDARRPFGKGAAGRTGRFFPCNVAPHSADVLTLPSRGPDWLVGGRSDTQVDGECALAQAAFALPFFRRDAINGESDQPTTDRPTDRPTSRPSLPPNPIISDSRHDAARHVSSVSDSSMLKSPKYLGRPRGNDPLQL